METYLAVGLGVIVLELALLILVLLAAGLQAYRTYRAIQTLTCRVREQAASASEAFRGGWMSLAGALINLVSRRRAGGPQTDPRK